MKRLNKKGFTLIELLAVIVVLAIIMVIATQQVNNTIKKSRGNTYYETVQSIRKASQLVCAEENQINKSLLDAAVEYSDVEVTFSSNKIIVTPTPDGKFSNMNKPTIKEPYSWVDSGDITKGITFTADCSATTTTTD